jgi:hypothetical protein
VTALPSSRPRRALLAFAILAGVVASLALASGAGHASANGRTGTQLPLPYGGAWYSETLDTSPGTAANHSDRTSHTRLQKWITWQHAEYVRTTLPGLPTFPGSFESGDNEPGFGDWDALSVFTLPPTGAGVMRLLESGRLEAGQQDPAERTSPLSWLAQLGTMLVDDPNTPAARAAALAAIEHLPGLLRVGQVRDPQGRAGVAVAEQASDLHPLQILTGPGCHNPDGGPGCTHVASPSGRYQLELILDPHQQHALAMRTVALDPIPAALIAAGQPLYIISYLQSRLVPHPDIPPLPPPMRPSVQSVPWHLIALHGREITVGWSSGTCVLPRRRTLPRPRPIINETQGTCAVVVDGNCEVNGMTSRRWING